MVAGDFPLAADVDWPPIEGEARQAVSAKLKHIKKIPDRRNVVRVEAIVKG